MLFLLRQRVHNDEHRVGDEGEGCGQREPLEDPLLGVGDIVVDGALDKVARGVSCGQGLASRARGGGLGDISIRTRRGDAADGEGHEEEQEHNDGVGILQCPDGLVQRLGMAPSRGIGGEESQVELELQFRVHDVLLLRSSETRMRGLTGGRDRKRDGRGREGGRDQCSQ
jgi:hypothetical protein